jgi:death-on-curing protein
LTEYLDLADYLLIAETVLGVPAERIAGWPGVGRAESALNAPAASFGGVEFYPDVIDKAAVPVFAWRATIRCRTGTSASPIWP